MKDTAMPGPDWIPAFLKALAASGKAYDAFKAAGTSKVNAHRQRNKNAQFRDAWDAALTAYETNKKSPTKSPGEPAPEVQKRAGGKNAVFLELLAETSNVTASAHSANLPISTVYKLKRLDPGFAAKWRTALYEGYEQLEMEVLAYLRGNLPEKKLDVANALRLLAAHRKTVAEIRAVEEDEDEQAVLDSIDEMIDRMRAQAAEADKTAAQDG